MSDPFLKQCINGKMIGIWISLNVLNTIIAFRVVLDYFYDCFIWSAWTFCIITWMHFISLFFHLFTNEHHTFFILLCILLCDTSYNELKSCIHSEFCVFITVLKWTYLLCLLHDSKSQLADSLYVSPLDTNSILYRNNEESLHEFFVKECYKLNEHCIKKIRQCLPLSEIAEGCVTANCGATLEIICTLGGQPDNMLIFPGSELHVSSGLCIQYNWIL